MNRLSEPPILARTSLDATQGSAKAMQSLPKVFVFSGQGTQSYFMAKTLYDADAAFRRSMLDLDGRFKHALGHSVLAQIYDSSVARTQPLDNILISHPAIFMVEYALARTLIDHGIKPDLVLGASLGELAAAAVAGALAIEEAVALVALHARVLDRASPPGGMIAILHDARLYDQIDTLRRHSQLAAVNYASHFVVAGDRSGLARVEDALRQRAIPFLRLPVKQPFHSPLIDCAGDEIRRQSPVGPFSPPAVPLVSCATGGRVEACDANHFWRVIREPIRLFETVRWLEGEGSFNYIDVGPAGSFSNSIKRILSDNAASRVYQILTLFSIGTTEFDRVIRDFRRPRAGA